MTPAGAGVRVATAGGVVEGRRDGEVVGFLGIPFGAAPVGPGRFAAPRPAPGWTGVRDASRPGPAAPQAPGRLDHAIGPLGMPQDEDCLTLNVWTPAADRSARPVVVFLHGGGFTSGSGGMDRYNLADFAAAGDLVAVSANYRLGALGYLYLGEAGVANAGLLDQIAALRWVREHAAAFGGDPERITVLGQSAGAQSIIALMAAPAAAGLFQRAVLQSPPLGMRPLTTDQAAGTAERFVHVLEQSGGGADLRERPAQDFLDAQDVLARAGGRLLDLSPPLQLVADGEWVQEDLTAAVAAAPPAVDVLLGWNRDEVDAFYTPDPRLRQLTHEQVAGAARKVYGDAAAEAAIAAQLARHPEATPGQLASALTTEHFLAGPTARLAARLADAGGRVFVYRFDWHPEGNLLRACHCLELPFVFGNTAAWKIAPMMEGARPGQVAELVRVVRGAWIAFAHTGSPQHAGLPDWPAHRPGQPALLHLAEQPRLSQGRDS
ncbi:carboxylesterase/lipase family protein [Streptomyces sp. IBSBF 2435]|uniref:carboxylesterase/lipase family protein n=1 Tax=Streptomyces sp. IBSBF 2435 TaxID=2903531 RepID=UPI002FDC21D9